MKRVLLCFVVGLIASCTPNKGFRDRLKKAGSHPDERSEVFEIPDDIEVKAEPLSTKSAVIPIPRVIPHGETWLPRTLAARDLNVEWSKDHKKVFVRGSAQWSNPSTNSSGDVPFVLAGNWNSDKGISNLVAVNSETRSTDAKALVRGRIYCIESNDDGLCSSSIVELFVRVNGIIFSGQIEKISPEKIVKEPLDDFVDSQEPGYNDELAGFDQDLEAVGSNENELDELYQQKDIENEEDEIVDDVKLPTPPSSDDSKLPAPRIEDGELEKSMDVADEITRATPPPPPPPIDEKDSEEKLATEPTKPIDTGKQPNPPADIPKSQTQSPVTVPPTKKVDVATPPPVVVSPKSPAEPQPAPPIVPKVDSGVKAPSVPTPGPGTVSKEKMEVPTTPGVKPSPAPSIPPTTRALPEDSSKLEKTTAPKKTEAESKAEVSKTIPEKTTPPQKTEEVKKDSQSAVGIAPPDVLPPVKNEGAEKTPSKTEIEEANTDKTPEKKSPDENQVESAQESSAQALAITKYQDQSVGTHARGTLRKATNLKAVVDKMAERSRIRVVHSEQKRYYGNYASVEFLVKASILLNRIVPNMFLEVGDLSSEKGGRLRPHKSHQNGLDMDVGFFFEGIKKGYYGKTMLASKGMDSHFDRALHWKFFKSLMTYYHDKVYFILLHPSVKRAMCEEAVKSGDIVKGKDVDPIVMHTLRRLVPESSHHNHFHVRLKCPTKDSRCIQTTRDLSMTMGCFKKK